jgi:hypothetical protein
MNNTVLQCGAYLLITDGWLAFYAIVGVSYSVNDHLSAVHQQPKTGDPADSVVGVGRLFYAVVAVSHSVNDQL